MSKKVVWPIVSGLMALSLIISACSPAATPATPAASVSSPTTTAPSSPTPAVTPAQERPQNNVVAPVGETPKYGGTLSLSLTGDITTFDLFNPAFNPGRTFQTTNDPIWAGDWTKGTAGGYGSGVTDWGMSEDIIGNKAGQMVESWKWTVDSAKNQANLIYEVRQGVHWALNPKSEASKLVNGREMTVDDVIYTLNLLTKDNRTYMYAAYPELHSANITKTGPWEITITTTVDALMSALFKFGYWGRPEPPEVIAKYGSMLDWKNSVGTGPFMLTDNIPGSAITLIRNPNYWGKDPIGPGKGNQLPYIDSIRYLIIPDASTRLAALRTGKYDQMRAISPEDKTQYVKTTPELKVFAEPIFGSAEIHMRIDQPPFTKEAAMSRARMALSL